MKKRKMSVVLVSGMVLGGAMLGACGNADYTVEKENIITQADASAEKASVEVSDIPEESKLSVEAEVAMNTEMSVETESPLENNDAAFEEVVSVVVENPSWEYYIGEEVVSETIPYEITLLEKKENQIIDREEWFVRNELEKPEEAESEDENYSCAIGGDGDWITVIKDEVPIVELDFSAYQYSDDYQKVDEAFVKEEIGQALIVDGILYVSTFHYTYAASAPSNAYITAISLEDYRVLWKTEPLVCNSKNFELVGDVIFCGYGFTAEPDTLYQLDKNTGEIIAQEPLKSMAEYIIYQDDKLFVRTYNTDYVFEVKK